MIIMKTISTVDNPVPIYEFYTDEIPTCPLCGVRSEPKQYCAPDGEEHKCPSCGYSFIVEYVEEEVNE